MAGMVLNYYTTTGNLVSSSNAQVDLMSRETRDRDIRESLLAAEAELEETETELAVLQDKYKRLQKLAYRLLMVHDTVSNEEWDEFLAPVEEAGFDA